MGGVRSSSEMIIKNGGFIHVQPKKGWGLMCEKGYPPRPHPAFGTLP